MKLLELEDRLYTSTEVAKILGVSLRSVYRYLEDNKLEAEMKTATGRHRFTKQNILDFLSPQVSRKQAEQPEEATPEATTVVEEVEVAEVTVEATPAEESVEDGAEDDEEVDWLAKFRAAAARYKASEDGDEDVVAEEVVETAVEEEVPEEPQAAERQSVSGLVDASEEDEDEPVEEESVPSNENYYTSGVGGLKDVAQNLDKSARKASLDYAFTMDSGLSLHKPIRPFSVIHSYVRSEDLPFFEKILNLVPAGQSDAQLCLRVSDDDSVYADSKEMHGLRVVSDAQLRKDLLLAGEDDLVGELE